MPPQPPKPEGVDAELLVLSQLAKQVYAEARQRRERYAEVHQKLAALRAEMTAQGNEISRIRRSLTETFRDLQRMRTG